VPDSKRYIVTGGGGFLGKALCRRLLRDGHSVTSLARGSYPELEALGVRTVRADLSGNLSSFIDSFSDIHAVFHVAAKVDMWGEPAEFFRGNVQATRNVIEACLAKGVKRLVFTSSPSVIADGSDLNGVDESYPYPSVHTAEYPATKAQAEREVLSANGRDGLSTISLRPHLIWGPGDTNLIPTIQKRARTGKLVIVGSGDNVVDLSYIDDCVQAHILACEALDNNPASAGRPYFISQGQPVKMWEWINSVLKLSGLPPVTRKISKPIAMNVARIMEGAARILPGHLEPPLTRFLVSEMSTNHYFDISAAKNALGYSPSITIEEGLKLTFGSDSADQVRK
jgi:2-alkyl-3-oxoalkanoate reductase